MKWVFVAIGVVASLIAVVVVAGMLLPRDHVAAMSARIMAPPDTVWATLTNPAEFTNWRADLRSVDMLPSVATGRPSWREHSRSGSLTMVMDVAESPHRVVTRIADDNVPYGGTWECIIKPDGPKASRVIITERGSVHNPVFRFVSRYVMGHTATIDAYLRALGNHFGSEPIPVVVYPGDTRGI